ncbi:HTH-type transcriptional regulator SgrR [Mangrovibacter phragmitis]|uniref:HTH-type transcriptional regulator SgrR n=1 Tax=Mangrovibacter phragmitis TaxID=1691903 RepID=UPI00336A6AEA
MASTRLQQQFIRLWQCCDGQPQSTTLHDLSTLLNCSRRHMRTLLNAMQAKGWLTWEAEAGRGKRSQLAFIYTGLSLQQQRAEDLLEQDRVDQLVQIVGDKDEVKKMLLSHLGRSFRQGRHILRVLYYRPLLNLLPGTPLRRSETHIVRQIFNGLTRINEENGELEADIAHHWQQLSPCHWRFFLRPGVHFHHGRELEMADVLYSLNRVNQQPLYEHIARISSPTNWTLDIILHEPDNWLPWLMAGVSAMILPREWESLPHFATHPTGTGPYSVTRNNTSQLSIQAFDDYFGFRALIDEVNIWVLPEIGEDMSCGVFLEDGSQSEKAEESRLEEGCYYLLFDQRSKHGANPHVRAWLSQVLSPVNILADSGPQYHRLWFPAWGLLPRWHHTPASTECGKPEGLTSLTLTFYADHIEHRTLSDIISKRLAQHGIHLVIQEISYNDWFNGDVHSDIWLNSANFTLPLDYSVFAHLYEIPLLSKGLGIAMKEAHQQWRTGELNAARWARQCVEQQHILPLIHHWLTIQGQRSMRGLRMNTLGWFDFKSAWFAPPEN